MINNLIDDIELDILFPDQIDMEKFLPKISSLIEELYREVGELTAELIDVENLVDSAEERVTHLEGEVYELNTHLEDKTERVVELEEMYKELKISSDFVDDEFQKLLKGDK